MNQRKSSLKARFLVSFVAFLFIACTSFAQRPLFSHFGPWEGLTCRKVQELAFDPRGFLWLATADGLVRFDGRHFTRYTTKDGLPVNRLQTVCIDARNMLWIGSDAGVTKFDGQHFLTFNLTRSEDPGSNSVRIMCVAPDSSIWCRVNAGNIFSVDHGKIKDITPSQIRGSVEAMLPGKTVDYFCSRGFLFRRNHNHLDSFLINPRMLAHATTVADLLETDDGRILMAANTGIFVFDSTRIYPLKIRDYPDNIQGVTALTTDAPGSFWAGTSNGVYHITSETTSYFGEKNGLGSSVITGIKTDKWRNIWIATATDGLYRRSPGQPMLVDAQSGFTGGAILSFATDGNNRIYAGTAKGALYVSERGNFFKIPFPARGSTPIQALRFYRGSLWIGTGGAGLWKYNGATFFQFNHQSGALPSNDVHTLFSDTSGRLWIGCANGLAIYEHDTFRRLHLPHNVVNTFASDKGHILTGTQLGLMRYESGKLTPLMLDSGLKSVSIECLLSSDELIWMGTSQGELLGYHPTSGELVRLEIPDDGNTPEVLSLASDDNNNVLAGTTRGLYRVLLLSNNRYKIVPFENLPNSNAVSFTHGVMGPLRDAIWFGTQSGAVVVQQPLQNKGSLSGRLSIVKVTVNSHPVRNKKYFDSLDTWTNTPWHLKLPTSDNSLGFYYNYSSVTSQGYPSYRYKLEGTHMGWSDWSSGEEVYFAGLPPGHYTFHLAAEIDGQQINLAYPFSIHKPFIATVWFRLLVLLICGLVGAGIHFIAVRRKEIIQHQRRLITQERIRLRKHKAVEEINSTLNQQVSDAMQTLKAFDNSKLLAGKTLLLQQLEKLRYSLGDVAWLLRDEEESVWDMIERLGQLGRELFESSDTEFYFQNDEALKVRVISPDVSREVILLFRQALLNCHEHAQAKAVRLESFLRKPYAVQLVLQDDGSGFDVKQLAKKSGLEDMERLAKALGGRLYVDSGKDRGTIVTFTFRLPEADEDE